MDMEQDMSDGKASGRKARIAQIQAEIYAHLAEAEPTMMLNGMTRAEAEASASVSGLVARGDPMAPQGDITPLSEFADGQWWLMELDGLTRQANPLTPDQHRAIAVVRNLMRTVEHLNAAPAPVAQGEPVAMQTHELKTDPEVFRAVLDGIKTYEIRKNDRGFSVGDTLVLRETLHTGHDMGMGSPLFYTGRVVKAAITHMLTGPIYGLAAGWSILSLRTEYLGLTAPAPVAPQPLTDEQIDAICVEQWDHGNGTMRKLARAIERAHGIKGAE